MVLGRRMHGMVAVISQVPDLKQCRQEQEAVDNFAEVGARSELMRPEVWIVGLIVHRVFMLLLTVLVWAVIIYTGHTLQFMYRIKQSTLKKLDKA